MCDKRINELMVIVILMQLSRNFSRVDLTFDGSTITFLLNLVSQVVTFNEKQVHLCACFFFMQAFYQNFYMFTNFD